MVGESNNESEGGDKRSYDELQEIFHDEYTRRVEDGWFELSNEGIEAGEILYKAAMAQALEEDREDSLPGGWGVEGITLGRLANEIMDVIEASGEYDDAKDREIRFLISDEFVLFYTLANEIVQALAGEIIDKELFHENRRGKSSLEVARELPQEVKEDLLFYSGIIDNGLKGEMANVRLVRNKLIHDIRNRQYLTEIENIESRLSRAFNVINELHVLMYDHTLFSDS
jgi:hypothetical protein